VADLIVALGAGSATVAGHDWGGALAWLLAMQHPEHVERLVVLNAPYPIRFLKRACVAPAAAAQLVHARIPAPVAARPAGGGPALVCGPSVVGHRRIGVMARSIQQPRRADRELAGPARTR
jgi:pimeloyl-ACP methyl ester carboxylesterase